MFIYVVFINGRVGQCVKILRTVSQNGRISGSAVCFGEAENIRESECGYAECAFAFDGCPDRNVGVFLRYDGPDTSAGDIPSTSTGDKGQPV